MKKVSFNSADETNETYTLKFGIDEKGRKFINLFDEDNKEVDASNKLLPTDCKFNYGRDHILNRINGTYHTFILNYGNYFKEVQFNQLNLSDKEQTVNEIKSRLQKINDFVDECRGKKIEHEATLTIEK